MPRRQDVYTGRFIAEADYQRQVRAILDEAGDIEGRFQYLERRVGREAVLLFKEIAPEDTGRLKRGIRAVPGGRGLEIVVEAMADDGYDYVGVTRFGHDTKVIVPIEADALATKLPPNPPTFRMKVRGVVVTHDWAQPGFELVEEMVDQQLEELGEEIMDDIARRGQ